MAIIYSYPTVEPKLIDKILITQSYNVDDEEPIEGNPTKSVKISSIGQLLGTTGAAPKINFGYNAYYGRDMFISGIDEGPFDGVQVTNEFVIGKLANTTGDVALYFKYGDERVGGIYLDDDASQQGLAFYVQESATNANIVKKISLREPVTIGSALASTLPPANGLAVQGGITAASISATNGTFANQLQVEGDARIAGALVDSSANAGTAGQVLSSTVTGTAWIPNNAAATYSIGDFAHGGIVFWVDETGQHGLVCAKEDQSSGVRWYAGTYGVTQAKGDGVYSGKANTVIIIAATVAIGDDGNTYAARICNELQITESGITYGDWYLPSKFEVGLMHVSRATIDATASANGGSNFSNNAYWCSLEIDNDEAWVRSVNNGVTLGYDKSNNFYVRAVRAF